MINNKKLGKVPVTCVILGGGGHTKGLIDSIIASMVEYKIVGILDPDQKKWGTEIQGVRVIGGDDLLKGLAVQGVKYFIVGLGGAGNCKPRIRLYEYALEAGLKPLSIIHPTAYVSTFATIGQGVQIMPHATVMPGTVIGDNVILNTSSIIEHDCVVGSHSHVSSGSHLAGNVVIGSGSHLGIGSVVKQGIKIGDYVVVGAGAVVVKDIPSNLTVVGNPAKRI